MTKKVISQTINWVYRQVGMKDSVVFADQLMYTGFRMSTKSGISFCLDDIMVQERSRASSKRRAKVKGHR